MFRLCGRGLTAVLIAGFVASAAAGRAAGKSAAFDVTAVHSGMGGQVTITSKVWVTPTQARADVHHPLEGDLRFLVTEGFFYQLDPKGKRGIKGPLPPEMKKSKDNFAVLVSQFTFNAGNVMQAAPKVRTETFNGYVCDVHSKSMSKGEASRSITVWVPQSKVEPRIPVKAIMEDKMSRPGATMTKSVTVTLSNLRLQTAIPPSTFAVPAGYKITVGKPAPPKARR